MKKRIVSLLMALLMLVQMLPVGALAEEWSTAVSNEVRGASYVKVQFQYPVYAETEDGGETISRYETIVTQMVEVGQAAVEPNIPDVAGHAFTDWVDASTGAPLDVGQPVYQETVFTAAYRKLGTYTVTIDYVFDIDGSMAQEPYVAEFEDGSAVDLNVQSPAMEGFEPDQPNVEVKMDAIRDNVRYEVRYKGQQTFYTVRYHFQNESDNGYTEGGFTRYAIHDHDIDDGLPEDARGWIAVGPYEISFYPDGTSQAGKPVIAGGMTEVRNMEIEGFVQQEIVQRRVMPGGTTVVDVYYDREVHTYTIKNDGGTAVDSRAMRYGAPLLLPNPDTMERPGYTFDGYFSKEYAYQDGQWVATGGEVEHNSSCRMPPYDFEIEVRWKPVARANYKVVYWVQSVRDAYNTPDEDKTYDYLSSETLVGDVGTMPRVNDIRPQDRGLSSTFFARNTLRSEIGPEQGNRWTGYYATSTKAIANDGSTVINVYFDRQTVTYTFYDTTNGRDLTNQNRYMTLQGLYGQSFAEASAATGTQVAWPAAPSEDGRRCMWRGTDRQNIWTGGITYLSGFYASDLDRTSVNLYKKTSSSAVVRQYTENLDGSWYLADDFTASTGGLDVVDKFAPGFSVTGYDTSRYNAVGPTDSIPDDKNIDGDYIEIYNTRNSFNLTYANCAEGSMNGARTSYLYEEPLQAPEIVPERPDNVESDYVFAGWYLDEGFQVPVNWGTYTMPAANLVVYAKWTPPTYTVTYHDVRIDTLGNRVEYKAYPFVVPKFGKLADCEGFTDFNTNQYVFDKTTYTDEKDLLTYTFIGWYLDEDYTVRWSEETPITGDRDVYARWEPSGTVWYRYVFMGYTEGGTEVLGKWPEKPLEETVWPSRPYGEFAEASKDFANAGLADFPKFEGWRAVSVLSTVREQLTEQYQEIPVYYVPTTTWPLTIHYVDEEGQDIVAPEEHDLTEAIKVYSYRQITGYKLTSAPQITASRTMEREEDGRVHITFHYEKIRPEPYRVEYYQQQLDGSYALVEGATVTYTEETSRWYLGETAEVQTADVKVFTGFTRNQTHEQAVHQVILKEDAEQNVLRLYYDRNAYTVTYMYNGGADIPNLPELPETRSYPFEKTVTVEPKPEMPGYTFNGWNTADVVVSYDEFEMPAYNVTFRGNWIADTDTEYTVEFYFQNSDGLYPGDPTLSVQRGGETGTLASVTEVDKGDQTRDGLLYRLDNAAPNVESGIIEGDGSLVLKLYFAPVTAQYTVHHYLLGTQTRVAEDETRSAQVGSSVTATAAAARNPGFDGAVLTSAEPVNRTIVIAEDAAQNVVTLYYTMPLTLQANSKSKTYDGLPLREGGFTVVNPENLVGISPEQITLSMTSASQILNPGSGKNEIDSATIRMNGKEVPGYYMISLLPGTLTVVSRLSVTKTVTTPATALEGETGSALTVPAFQFILKRDGAPVAGARYRIGGAEGTTDGEGKFALQAGETAAFDGLEAGSYTVEEIYNGDWIPDGNFEQSAQIAASGAGDVGVTFNNRRTTVSRTLQKRWVDGQGSAAQRPETLSLKLQGMVGDAEVYSAPVTLKAEENWQITVNALPASVNGTPIAYRLVEEDVPEGYTASYSADGQTVTNTVTQRQLTLQGTKTWVDGGRAHNNAQDVTLTLQRRANNGGWVTYTPGAGSFAWEGNRYTFSNLPAYDANGYAYDYRVVETEHVPNIAYTIAYADAAGKPNDGIAAFDEHGLAIVNITNTIVDNQDRTITGTKTWIDGGAQHDNAAELTLSLQRKSTKEGAGWESNFADADGYAFSWGEDAPDTYTFSGLERYDDEGYRYIYKVVETINDPEDAARYEVTYSPENGETSVGGVWQVNITNTLIDPSDVSVTGQKTWVDGGKPHDNETEITLTLSRTSAKPGAQPETVEATPNWEDDRYTFSGLERYDAEGYAYTYSVAEAPVAGYTTTQSDFDFTNTLIDPSDVSVTGQKTWVDGNKPHDNAREITLTLSRTSAKPGAQPETVEATPKWEDDRYTFSGLDRYDDEGYAYTYSVAETAIADYTTTQSGFDFTNTLIDPSDVSVTGQKTWVDGNKPHDNETEITLTLSRTSAKPGAQPETVEATPKWEGNQYTFSGLDRYDDEGYAYTYSVAETAIADYTTTQSGFDFTNTLFDPSDVIVTGQKTWVDGNKPHDNAREITLTLSRTSAKPGAQPETVEATPKWEGNQYTFSGLDRYDDEGYAYTYSVAETAIADYTTTQQGFNFTNTLIDPSDVSVTGQKTWVDGNKPHDNAREITLTLSRTSAKPDAQPETVEATPNWEDDRYTFSGLDRYDDEGYAYTYSVAEVPVAGYTTTQQGFNFTNTIAQEWLTLRGAKTWTDGEEGHTTGQVALTLERQSDGGAWARVEAEPVWSGWTYTYGDLEKYDSQGYAYTYRVQETTVAGYTVQYTPADGVAVFGNGRTATVDIVNAAQTREVTVEKVWVDAFNAMQDYYGLRPDDVTVTLTGMVNGQAASSFAYTVSGAMWNKGEASWTATVPVRTHDAGGNVIEYAVSEAEVSRYALDAASSTAQITPAQGEDSVSVVNRLKVQNVTVHKVWEDAGWEALRPEIRFELSNGDKTLKFNSITLEWNGADVVFENVPQSDAYVLSEHIDNAGSVYSYDTNVLKTADGTGFTVTNSLKLLGGDGTLTVKKTWEDHGGDPAERPEVSFQLLDGSGTPVEKDGAAWIVPLGQDGAARFENVPERTDGYIVREIVNEQTNVGDYVCAQQDHQVVLASGQTEAGFTNTRTMAVVTVRKAIVDETTDSAAGLSSQFRFGVDGVKSEAVGNGGSVQFEVEIGKPFELTEYDADGNELAQGVWNTSGLGSYTAQTSALEIVVTNTRTLWNGDGAITVSKTWLDGDGKPLEDRLIPAEIGAQLYAGGTPVGQTVSLSRENGWSHRYERLPATALDGTAHVYSVKEVAGGKAYGDQDTMTVNGLSFGVRIDGFAMSNALMDSVPVKPEKTADEESEKGVQAGDEVQYTIRRVSHLSTETTATVTDALPSGLVFVKTDSVKVNGVDAGFEAKQAANGTVQWVVDQVPPMGVVEVVFTARVTERAIDVIENRATVDLGDDQDAQFESDGVKIPVVCFRIEKAAALPDGKTQAARGDAIDYTVTITNTGAVNLSDMTLTDQMLKRAEANSIRVNGKPAAVEGDTLELPPIRLHTSVTVEYRVIVEEADVLQGAVDNLAVARAKDPSDADVPDIVHQAQTHTPTVMKNGHLTVTKETVSKPANGTAYKAGEVISYRILVKNDGNLTIRAITVTDILSKAEGQVIGRIDSLEPGESEAFSFAYEVTQADAQRGAVKNEATAKGVSPDPQTPEVPVTPGTTEDKTEHKTEDKTEEEPKTEPKDDSNTESEEPVVSSGVDYASTNVLDCCE